MVEAAISSETDECIVWTFCINPKTGYGTVTIDGKTRLVHRYVCEIVHGPPPTPSHQAAHDNNGAPCVSRSCINPKHLRWATSKENQSDRLRHGTYEKGENSRKAKLEENQVRQIMSLSGQKSQREIAEAFGVSASTVSLIHRGARWGWVTDGMPRRSFLGPRVTDLRAYKAAKARQYRAAKKAQHLKAAATLSRLTHNS